MYQELCLIHTHRGNDLNLLKIALNQHSNVVCLSDFISIKNFSDLKIIQKDLIKRIGCGLIVDNHNFALQKNLPCKHAIFLQDPSETINYLVSEENYTLNNALDYYGFRLQRLAQLYKKLNPVALIDLNSLRILQDLLNLKDEFYIAGKRGDKTEVNLGATSLYDNYFGKIKI